MNYKQMVEPGQSLQLWKRQSLSVITDLPKRSEAPEF